MRWQQQWRQLLRQLRQQHLRSAGASERTEEELQITHKGRSERAVALEEAIEAMTSIQLKKELESRGMCSDGRAPDLQLRLGLELAGRCQPDSIGSHSAAAAAVTAAMSAMQKQLQPQLQSVRLWVATAESIARRLLGVDADEFDEVIIEVWVSRFKYRIKLAPGRFELGATPCPTHVGGHLDQLWDSNKSYLSISLRVQDTFLK